MTTRLALFGLDERAISRLGELLALKVQPGDAIALRGDLGAGKTTLARAFIRAVLQDADAEVPSPTFPIVQPYQSARINLWHFDLYRISGADELAETGFDEALANGLVLIEWPERAEDALPADRLDVRLSQGPANDLRDVSIEGHGTFADRLARVAQIRNFLDGPPLADGLDAISYLQGDASARAYARIRAGERHFVLMDSPRMPDGPAIRDGLPYSRIARLAEDVRPFVAIGTELEAQGFSVPHIHNFDLDAGLLLLEDLGDLTFGRALAEGVPQEAMWSAAVDILAALRARTMPETLPLPDGSSHRLARFNRDVLEIELSLILDWYWPEVHSAPPSDEVRQSFMALWSPVLDRLLDAPPGLFLRDFHSPNLFWLPDRPGVRSVGVIDFQDALRESWALDLVSLLQDARVDVPAALEARELARYLDLVRAAEPELDGDQFRWTYAAFGAQRNTRLVGLWVRLLRRDRKPGYLKHMPRTWDYLARNLAHPDLSALKAWYDQYFPESLRAHEIAP